MKKPRKRKTKAGVAIPTPLREVTSRRRFIAQGATLLGAGAALSFPLLARSTQLAELDRQPVRPPSASNDDEAFQAQCIRCGLCGTVCENGCIRFYGLDEGRHGALTPYLDVRRRSCTLCMRCTQICPTGALRHIDDDLETIAAEVRMGLAVVDADRCISYLGRVCGYCHDACPLPGQAISLMPPAKPIVNAEGCVGCGRCVELCPQFPTAIDVVRVPV